MNNPLKDFLIGLAVGALLAGGVTAAVMVRPAAPAPVATQQVVGGSFEANGYNPLYLHNGLAYNQLTRLSSVSASTTIATSTNIQLGSGAAGELTIGTGTPATNVVYASTTVIGPLSVVTLQQLASTTIPGVTCNSTATVTPLTSIYYVSSTLPSLNGFSATSNGIPVTNPLCYKYSIENLSPNY